MATVGDLAALSSWAYQGTQSALSQVGNGAWSIVAQGQNPLIGFHAYTVSNSVTKDVVMVFRGTDGMLNLLEDGVLGSGLPAVLNPITEATLNYVEAQEPFLGTSTVTTTGHSLGGYAATIAAIALQNNPNFKEKASLTAVTFNSPSTEITAPVTNAHVYDNKVFNFFTQGDLVHLTSGPFLGQSATLASGPTPAQEAVDFANGFDLGRFGLRSGLAQGIRNVYSDLVGPAHTIDNFWGVNTEFNNTPGYFNTNTTQAAETPAQWFQQNSGIAPSTALTFSNGTAALTDAGGDKITLTSSGSGGGTTGTLTLGGSTQLTSLGSISGLQSEISVDGPVTVPNSVLNALSPGSGLGNDYSILGPPSLSGFDGIGGTSPAGVAAGDPGSLPLWSPSKPDVPDRYELNVPTTDPQETILGGSGVGTVWVNGADAYGQLQGGAPVSGSPNTWVDTNGTRYVYTGAAGSSTGTLTITHGLLGDASTNSITIDDFNIQQAAFNPEGFLGITLPLSLSLSAGTVVGNNSPASFAAGSEQAYTISSNAPSSVAQTVTVSLSGASSSDFQAIVGNNPVQIGANGSFQVTLAAGQTNVAFGLIDTTPDNGQSDIASGTTLQLTASVASSLNGSAIQTTPLTISYDPEAPDSSTLPQPSSVITGTSSGGTTTYQGDGGDDSIAAGAGPNRILASNSGSDSIVGGSGSNTIYGGSGNDVFSLNGSQDWVSLGDGFNTVNGSSAGQDTIYGDGGSAIINGNNSRDLIFAGNGNNEVYAGTQTSLANALSQARSGTPTHQQGDLLSVLDGNNTVVSGNGNDLITAGTGDDVIVLGSGNDTFVGGVEVTNAASNWSATVTQTGEAVTLNFNNVTQSVESYTNPYLQPYNGSMDPGTNAPDAMGNDTVFGSTGADFIVLGNGNNYVQAGSGNTTIFGGMGNDTIIAGSGNDLLDGGGGAEYFNGGSGTDTIIGGDGNNTIIGGSGNATIQADSGGRNGTYAGANLEQNYVTGGSGNDLIYGSSGSDTLIGGTGNVTIYGGSGNENITGGSGTDALVAGTGNATLSAGGGGQDTLQGGTGASSTYVIYGGTGTDYITAQDGTDILYAGDGGTASAPTSVFGSQSDSTSQTTIYGGAGVDSLTGGSGNTVMYAGDGGTSSAPTSVYASSGNTTIYGGLGSDVLQGGSGTDVIYAGDGGTASAPTSVVAGSGVATLHGGAGSSLLQDLSSGQDLIVGGTSNDTLLGIGNDTLVAGTGNDLLQNNGGTPTVQIDAGFGNDAIVTNGGSAENLVFGPGMAPTDFSGQVSLDQNGNAGLLLSGDGGSIYIQNGLTGGLGAVSFTDSGPVATQALLTDAFGGDQTIINGTRAFLLNLGNTESIVAGLDPNDTVSSFGNNVTIVGGTSSNDNKIYAAGSGDLIATGTAAQDTVNATGNNDTIGANYSDQITVSGAGAVVSAGAWSDSITASGVNDTLIGGTANSLFYVNNPTTNIQAPNGGGTDTVIASVSYTAPTNINSLVLTGSANIAATGNSGNDSLTAGAGNDTLVAGSGADTLIGGSGTTTFVVNSTADVVVQTLSAPGSIQSSVSFTLPTRVDSLVLTGNTSLQGTANSDNDTLISNSGIDTLVGGFGNDTFVINNASDVVQDTFTTASNTVQASVSYVAPTNVSTLVLTGTAALQVSANAGNDTLVSNSGVDTLVGGSGNDTFVINNAADVVQDSSATASNTVQSSVSYTLPTNVNTLRLTGSASLLATGNGASNVITANGGADTLVAGSDIATLIGGTANDTFVVNNTADVVQDSSTTAANTVQASVSYLAPTDVNTLVLTGTANLQATANSGADTLISNSGIDTLVGGSGNDTFVINNTADVVQDTSTTANNVIPSSVSYVLPANVAVLQLTGSSGLVGTADYNFDSVTGNSGNDTLVASGFDDTLVAGSAPDTLVGSSGSSADTFVINSTADVINATAGLGGDTVQSSVSYTLPTGVNNLVLTGSANLAGTANSANDSLTAGSGADTLFGGSGSDTLVAGSGPTTLWGGTGADTFVVNSTADAIGNVSAAAGNVVVSSVNFTLPTGIDSLTLSGNGPLTGTGNSDAQNILTAGSGNDTLVSGSGSTTLVGGIGYDTFVVNNSIDVVEAQAQAPNTVVSSVSYTAPANVGTLILSGTANLTATGNTSADSIVGNSGNDTLTAGVGNDTLVAGAGLATLVGGVGNDTFIINNAADLVQDSHINELNTLISSVSVTLPVNVNALTLSGSGNLVGTANAANDSITGNAGADTLVAGAGNDTLLAGSGIDTLVGSTGNATFVVNNVGDVVTSASSSSANTVISSVSYTAPTNVNLLVLKSVSSIAGTGNAGSDTLIGGEGNDTLFAGAGIDTLVGGSGNTTFVVNNVSDLIQDTAAGSNNFIQSSVSFSAPVNVNTLTLTGSANLAATANGGNDTLVSNTGIDTLSGGAGNDVFFVNNASDVVQDSSATANVISASVSYVLPANVNTLVLTGTSGLSATANSGNDTLVSNSGVDTLYGGGGNDTFIVSNTSDIVQDSVSGGNNQILSSVSYTLPVNVDALVLTGSANLTATGNAAGDVLTANAGADTLIAGGSPATLIGGGGNDTFVVNNSSDVVQDSVAGTNNTIDSSASFTLPGGVNTLVLTGTTNLTATANSASDTLVSNSGIDTLVGGSAPELFVLNNSSDVIRNLKGTDTIESSVSFTLPGSGGNLVLIGSASIAATGDNGRDTLSAGAGNDTLVAGSGLATLIGGGGNTTFVVNSSSDIVQDGSSTTANAVLSSVSFSLPTNVDALVLTGTASISATGNSDATNVLTAGVGQDTLNGTAYATTLNGGSGPDIITAGPGSNVIYAGNGGSTSAPTYVYGDWNTTSFATQSTIFGGSGVDVIFGGPGSDVITTGTGVSTVTGGSGFETIYGSNGTNALYGGAGVNLIYGGNGTSLIAAGGGTNVIYAGNGGTSSVPAYVYGGYTGTNTGTVSTIYGGSGVDVLEGGPGQDAIYAGTGTDSLDAGTGYESLYGGNGDTLIDSLSGHSELVAGGGAETLTGSGGDTLVAGSGTDLLYDGYSSTAGSVYEFAPGFGQTTIGNIATDGGASASSNNDAISFESGITASALSLGESITGTTYSDYATALTINDGSNSIVINGGLMPGVVSSVSIGGSTESLAQLMDSRGPGSQRVQSTGYASLLSTGDGQTVTNDGSDWIVWTFGNNDVVTGNVTAINDAIVAYGNSNTISGSSNVYAIGNGDSITLAGAGIATLAGAADTLFAGYAAAAIAVYQASDVIQVAAGSNDSIDAFVSYTLPNNVSTLLLDSAVGGLAGTSNSKGGVLIARGNADTLVGGAGNDTLSAAASNVVLVGGSGSETYVLQSASDTIQFGSGAASLNSVQANFSYTLSGAANSLIESGNGAVGAANGANDVLTATGSSDTLLAGSGNDTLVDSSPNGVTLIGGSGNDTFVVNNTRDVIQDTATGASNSLRSSVSYTLPTNVNSITLTGTANLIATANSANDTLAGNSGNDTLVAGSGNDTLVAGSGNDTFVLNSGFGHDQIVGPETGDVLAFGSGIPQSDLTFTPTAGPGGPSLVISGDGGSVTVQGGLVPGAINSVQFNGGASSATVAQLVASGGRTTVAGPSGNLILSSSNNDSISGGTGQDTIIAWGNGDTLTAGAGGTAIYAAGSGDHVTGGASGDTLTAYGANNTLIGGAGGETFVVQSASTVVQVASAGPDTVLSSVSYTAPANVSVLTLTGTANLQATGNASNDTLTANSGNDTLIAGIGIDTFVAGSGADLFILNNSSDVIQVSGSAAQDTLQSSATYTLPSAFNTLVLTGTGGITGTGNAQSDDLIDSVGYNTLVAGTGGDVLTGRAGTVFIGGASNDVFSIAGGGAIGSNTFQTGTGVDTIANRQGAGTSNIYVNNSADVLQALGTEDRLYTSVSYTLAPNVAVNANRNWTLTGTANIAAIDQNQSVYGITITGNSGNDTLVADGGGSGQSQVYITAGDGNNVIVGSSFGLTTNNVTAGNGNNSLVGGSNATNILSAGTGIDTFVGGAAAVDEFIVRNSADVIQAQAGSTDEVVSYVSLTLPTNVNTLILQASGLLGTANSGNDTLRGASDTLVAGSGNDSLSSSGNSTLIAGTGNDTLAPWEDGDILLFNAGFGPTQIQQSRFAYLGPTVELGSGISAGNVTVSPVFDVTGKAGLVISAGTGAMTLDEALAGAPYRFQFGSGATLSLAQFLSQVSAPSATVTGASGNIVLENTAATSVSGGAGNDTIYALASGDTILGGSGSQQLIVLGTNDLIQAGTGNYTLAAYGDHDTINSGGGNDPVDAWGNYDVLTSGSHSGSGQVLTAEGSNELLTGGAGNDTLSSSPTLSGASNDTLVAGSTPQFLQDYSGVGTTTFVINNAADTVSAASSGIADTIDSSVSYTLPANVDSLVLTGSSNLTGVANTDNVLLVGNAGSDTLTAGSGLDTLVSGSGVDRLVAGTGSDLFVVNNASDVVQVGGTHGVDTVESSVSYTLPSNVALLTLIGTGSVTATGNTLSDVITGNAGNDTLVAGSGVATLVGGAGNDTFVVDNTRDVVRDSTAGTASSIQSSVSYTLPVNVNALTLTGSASLSATGNAQSDVLTANSGTDTLVAGSGLATLVGGTGSDLFLVNNVNDVVQVGATHGTDTIQSSVSYVLPANVAKLTLTGSGNLSATGNDLVNTLTANTGNDTLTAGSGVAMLVGGSGSDLFVLNSTSDVVSVGSTHGNDTIQSSVSYTASANVANLTLTGTANLAGTGNSLADVITANTGVDTLTAGTGVATLIGGSGNDTFVINNTADVVQDSSTGSSNTLSSTVSYTLPTNVNTLIFIGTAALKGTANAGNDLLTANTGADTLIAGSGTDTLIAGTSGADSLVGGSGTDLFEVNSTADVVSVASAGSDTVQSSVSYTLPNSVEYLTLTGTGALTATGNSLTDLIVGNSGNDTLNGGTGIAVLEGGRTAGQDVLKATGNQAAVIGGANSSTLTGGAFKDFFAAGSISDSITSGATANVISVNKGDGADTLNPTTSATNVLSLGAGIDTESLFFTKSTNNLVLTDGVTGDSVTFLNWYASSSNQVVTKLQVVEIASASYNSSGTDPLRNQALEEFNFTSLVSQFNTAGSPNNWALSNGMPSAQLTSSATQAYGGDLAYYFGLNGNLTGMNLSAAQSTLTNSSYATAPQTIDSWSAISGGSGLHLLIAKPPAGASSADAALPAAVNNPAAMTNAGSPAKALTVALDPPVVMSDTADSQPVLGGMPDVIRPHFGLQLFGRAAGWTNAMSFVTPAALGVGARYGGSSKVPVSRAAPDSASSETLPYVDAISFAWSKLHSSLSESRIVEGVQGSLIPEYSDLESAALLGSPWNAAARHSPGEVDRFRQADRRRPM